MKKPILIVLVLFVTLLFACKKDHTNAQPQSTGKTKYKISFNLNGFTQQVIGKASKPGKAKVFSLLSDTGSVRAMFDSIGYVLFDLQGNVLHYKMYNAKTYTASTISDSVLAGNYKVAIFAGQSGIEIENDGDTQVFIWYGLTNGSPQYFSPFKDTFEKTIALSVSNADINQNIALDRTEGDLEVVITDKIPANAYKCSMVASYDSFFYGLFYPGLHRPGDTPNSLYCCGTAPTNVIIPDSAKGKPNFKLDYLTVNSVYPFSFSVTCYDINSQTIAMHTFDTTTIQANVKKIYSGDLFGTPLVPGSGSSTTVNPVWNPITTNISF